MRLMTNDGRQIMVDSAKVVLILDADDAACNLYRRELARTYQVITCCTEHGAWEMLNKQQVDAIVLEPIALGDDDWNFVVRLHTDEHYAHIPIIICSTMDARRRGANMGVNAYLIKPASPQTVATAVATALSSAPVAVNPVRSS